MCQSDALQKIINEAIYSDDDNTCPSLVNCLKDNCLEDKLQNENNPGMVSEVIPNSLLNFFSIFEDEFEPNYEV